MKRIRILALVLTLVLLLASCGAGKYDSLEIDPAALCSELIAAEGLFTDEMIVLNAKDSTAMYSGISSAEGACACGIGAYAEEIAVLKCADAEDAKGACAVMSSYCTAQKVTFSTYAPAEVEKLNSAVIVTYGPYVVYAVTADNERAADLIDAYIENALK